MRCREQVWPTGKVIDVRDAARRVLGGACLAAVPAGPGKANAKRGADGLTGDD